MKTTRYYLLLLLGASMFLITFAGCAGGDADPDILTLWHNYGGQLKETMDALIDEFNDTVGAEKGIIINVTSISGTAAIHEKLTMAANEEPGAPRLPDITVAYPRTALLLAENELLVELDRLFSPEELDLYIPQYLDEGRLNGENLYIFPTAKSTEVLFLNSSVFDRFAVATGVTVDDLKTFEGIARVAALYYDWTDSQTPGADNDGKAFFMADSLYNYALVGCRQLGAEFVDDQSLTLHLGSPQYARVWESYFRQAVLGRAAIYGGYAADLFKTGEIICSTGSSAGVMFFSPTVTYPDNTTEEMEMAILPYPLFEGGSKIALQRGAGMCVTRSSKERELKAAVFLKWFTSPENNMRFVSSTGYLPVTLEAFDQIMSGKNKIESGDRVEQLFSICRSMEQEYVFLVPPLFEGVEQLQQRYEAAFKDIAISSREHYCELIMNNDPHRAYETVSGRALLHLADQF